MLFRFDATISIYYIVVSINCDFLFELDKLNLTIYTYLISIETQDILIRNKNNKVVYIFRNSCFNRITKLKISYIF